MATRDLKQDIFILIASIFAALMVGATILSFVENWSMMDAFYFVTMTATTVGYGDFTPVTPLGKFFTIFFSLSIIPFVLYTFSYVAKAQMEKVYSKIYHLEKQQKEQEEEIDDAERKLKLQKAELKEQEEILAKERKEINAQKRKIEEEAQMNQLQNAEIINQDQELEVVEGIVEDALKN